MSTIMLHNTHKHLAVAIIGPISAQHCGGCQAVAFHDARRVSEEEHGRQTQEFIDRHKDCQVVLRRVRLGQIVH